MSGIDWKAVTNKTPIRVMFYGRVSTEHEAQKSALKNQIQWYYDQLNMHPNWKLVSPIEEYLDRGITGTQAKKRPGFLRLIRDAQSGKCDMIVTREVCRFARNTVDTLQYVRELKSNGIQIYFVNDGIKTIEDNDGEYRLTIMAMFAQEESRKISERSKAGQYISRNNGVLYGTGNILGYKRIRKKADPDKKHAIGDKSVPTFAIVPEEAETVKLIFEYYAAGYGLRKIRSILIADGRKNSSGEVKWFDSSISRLLSNPMYIGKQYQCQTEVTDFLEHTVKKNKKEDYVLIEGDFEPIISEELFNKVQEIKAQHQVKSFEGQEYGYQVSSDKWINKLECGCGSRFQQYKWRKNESTGEVVKGYACRHRIVDGSEEYRMKRGMPTANACSMPSIPAWKFDFIAQTIFSQIWKDKKESILKFYDFVARGYNDDTGLSNRYDHLKRQQQRFKRKLDSLTELYTDGDITIEQYRSKKKEYQQQLDNIENELTSISNNSGNSEDDVKHKLSEIKNTLNSIVNFDSEWIDECIVQNYIDKVVTRTATDFEWYINLQANAEQFIITNDDKRSNDTYEDKSRKTLELQSRSYTLAFTSVITFDQARAFRKQFGKYLRANQWNDMTIKVYLR